MQLRVAGLVALLRDFFFVVNSGIEKGVTMNINTRNVNGNGRSGHVAIARRADGFSIILNHSHVHVLTWLRDIHLLVNYTGHSI